MYRCICNMGQLCKLCIIFVTEVQLVSDDRPPYADIELPSFTTAQPYDIYLRLVVPATTANYELGNFMSTSILSSIENETLASVRHPASNILLISKLLAKL